MKPEHFEQRLARTPHASLPGEWRRDLLAAARAAAKEQHDANLERDEPVSTSLRGAFNSVLQRITLPWTLFASGWGIVLLLNGVALLLENRPSAPGHLRISLAAPGSELSAARLYRAEILARWDTTADSALQDQVPEPPPASRREARPRGDSSPGLGRQHLGSEGTAIWS